MFHTETQEVLQLLNPWWKSGSVSQDLAKPYKRKKLYERLQELSQQRQIVILTGLRRVGKSTLLYQLLESLLKSHDSFHICYFSFDKHVEKLTEIFETYSELTKVDYKKEKVLFFLDEITKLDDWANQLKIFYDAFPHLKFYLSSSSSIHLEDEAIKILAGRYFIVNIEPLAFSEYLDLESKQDYKKKKSLYRKELDKEFQRYLLRNFPETLAMKDDLLVKDYLRTTIIDKIVKSDLPDKFKNVNKDLLTTLIELIYKEPGIYVDYDSLSKNLKVSKKTLIRHFLYLESSYLIRKIKNFRPSSFAVSRKLQRAYPYWWTLAYCFSDKEDKIKENAVGSIIGARYYWRKLGKEIDFLTMKNNNLFPIEVKNKVHIEKRDCENMRYFKSKYKSEEGIIIYDGKDSYENDGLHIIPFWKFFLSQK